MAKPRPAFSRPVAERVPRAELVRVANMYFSGMQLNDGKGKYPFADDCDRLENGGQIDKRTWPRRCCAPRSENGDELLRHVDAAASSSSRASCTS